MITSKPQQSRFIRLVAFLFLGSCLVVAPLSAEETHTDPGSEEGTASSPTSLDEWLEALKASRKELKTLHADFVEKRVSFLFQMEETATGQLYYERPLRLLWKYEDPEPIHVLAESRELRVFKPDLMQLEIFPFERDEDFRSLFLALEDSPEVITTRYEIEQFTYGPGGDTTIRLKPRRKVPPTDPDEETNSDPESGAQQREEAGNESESLDFLYAVIRFSGEDMLPRQITIRNSEEKETEVTFSNLETNIPLESAIFTLDVPPGTEIIQYTKTGAEVHTK